MAGTEFKAEQREPSGECLRVTDEVSPLFSPPA